MIPPSRTVTLNVGMHICNLHVRFGITSSVPDNACSTRVRLKGVSPCVAKETFTRPKPCSYGSYILDWLRTRYSFCLIRRGIYLHDWYGSADHPIDVNASERVFAISNSVLYVRQGVVAHGFHTWPSSHLYPIPMGFHPHLLICCLSVVVAQITIGVGVMQVSNLTPLQQSVRCPEAVGVHAYLACPMYVCQRLDVL